MVLKLYNTLSRQFDPAPPHSPVGLYVCGPTVYNYAHLGNWRTLVVADLLRRSLEYYGSQVKHVMNITDVDDKTIAASQNQGENLATLTKRYEQLFLTDFAELNLLPPTTLTRATEHLGEMIALIETLLEKGHAYPGENGIYFSINSFAPYGRLSGRPLDQGLEQDETPARGKRDHRDFALWKFPTPEDGPNHWPAPFGEGRPGWHIECSAMSLKELGSGFDYHLGGTDLIFPHHENEIAQSEAATGQPFAKHWVHAAFLMVNGQKMSKSLGNFFTLADIRAKQVSPLAYRYWLLTSHYRSLANFTWEALAGAESALKKLNHFAASADPSNQTVNAEYDEKFKTCLANDLNLPEAVALAWQLVKDESLAPAKRVATLLKFDQVLGLKLGTKTPRVIPAEITRLVAERQAARQAGNWAEADRLRQQITEQGFDLNDTATGTEVIPRMSTI